MKNYEDKHLRCEICDFCASAPSTFNTGIHSSYSENTPRPTMVTIRGTKALCNACYHAQDEIVRQQGDFVLTKAPKCDTILCSLGGTGVKVYPPTAPELTYYEEYGIDEEQKRQWRERYQRELMEGCVPFRTPFRSGGSDES